MKQNKQNLGLCGADEYFPRATFGPRAVCCACPNYIPIVMTSLLCKVSKGS